MTKQYFLGIDTSTTSSKALLIDERGDVIAVAASPHTLQTPRPLWSEQNPSEWWRAVSASIKSVLGKAGISGESVGAVGLTGQMHGLVLLDEAGNVLRPAILWNDQRTQSQCDEIHQRIGKERFIQITGNVALTGFTAPKILWVKENEPKIFEIVDKFMLPGDYIALRLTGESSTTLSGLSEGILFNFKTQVVRRQLVMRCLQLFIVNSLSSENRIFKQVNSIFTKILKRSITSTRFPLESTLY